MSSKIYIVGSYDKRGKYSTNHSKYATNREELERLAYEQCTPRYLAFEDTEFTIAKDRIELLGPNGDLEMICFFHTLERMQ